MDGNGRWAERRELPRSAGHREGIEAVRRVVEAAPDLGIGALTLFAFSSDNWRRPPLEVEVLMLLLRQYLRRDVRRLADNGVRLTVIGRRDRLPDGLAEEIAAAEAACALGTRLDLNVALDYSARDAIANAAADLARRRLAGARARSDACSRSRATAPAATSTCSSAPAARSGSRISCCGSAPTRNCSSPTRCGRTSAPSICAPRLPISHARAALRRPRWSRPNDFTREEKQ